MGPHLSLLTRLPLLTPWHTPLPLVEGVSGQWTAGELNPDLLVATQMSFLWTSSPCFNLHRQMEHDPVPDFRAITTRECSFPGAPTHTPSRVRSTTSPWQFARLGKPCRFPHP